MMNMNNQECWPSLAQTSERLNATEKAVIDWNDEVEQTEILKVKRIPGKRNRYRFNVEVILKLSSEAGVTGNPEVMGTGNPEVTGGVTQASQGGHPEVTLLTNQLNKPKNKPRSNKGAAATPGDGIQKFFDSDAGEATRQNTGGAEEANQVQGFGMPGNLDERRDVIFSGTVPSGPSDPNDRKCNFNAWLEPFGGDGREVSKLAGFNVDEPRGPDIEEVIKSEVPRIINKRVTVNIDARPAMARTFTRAIRAGLWELDVLRVVPSYREVEVIDLNEVREHKLSAQEKGRAEERKREKQEQSDKIAKAREYLLDRDFAEYIRKETGILGVNDIGFNDQDVTNAETIIRRWKRRKKA